MILSSSCLIDEALESEEDDDDDDGCCCKGEGTRVFSEMRISEPMPPSLSLMKMIDSGLALVAAEEASNKSKEVEV